jgi:hypothetical protein
MVWIGTVDKETYEVRPISQKGLGEDLFSSIKRRLNDSPSGVGTIGEALKTGTPIVDYDVPSDPAYALCREQIAGRSKSHVVLPVKTEESVVGVLNIFSDRSDAFKQDEIGVLGAFSQAIAVALERSKGLASKHATREEKKHVQVIPDALIDPGEVYIYGGSLEGSLRLFKNHLNNGWRGLVVADKSVVESYDKGLLGDVPTFKFTPEIGSTSGVWTYSGLSILLSSWIGVTPRPLALIDRLETLENGPERGNLVTFVEDLHRDVSRRDAATIIRMEKIEDKFVDALRRNCRFL